MDKIVKMNQGIPNRKDWVDGLRGIAMLLVVSGHCVSGLYKYFAITNSVKMPLFFAISGYLFKDNIAFISLIKKLSKRVILPWSVLGFFITTCFAFLQKESLLRCWYDMIAGEGIWWFLPCFFWGEILHYCMRRSFVNESVFVLASFFSFFLGCFMYEYEILNFMMINRAFVVQLFFCFGYIIKRNEAVMLNSRTVWGG